MSKRKLTKRQRLRIQKNQQAIGERVGLNTGEELAQNTGGNPDDNIDDARYDELANQGALGREQPGLIVAHYGAQVEVEPLNGDGQPTAPKRCHFRSNLGSLVAGDRVIWRDGEPNGLVVAATPRTTALCRPDPYGTLKTIAANVDRLLIVIAPLPEPDNQLIDRYIVAAEAAGIDPVVVLNKCDLLAAGNAERLRALVAIYRSIGYLTVEASAHTEDGMESLMRLLAQGTSVVVGQSGVGKSSLVNILAPTANAPVGELADDQKGAHTTTTARFFHLSAHGALIDSPGIRQFGLWHMDEQVILNGFVELRPWIGRCKFRDCQHEQEPGCSIRQAAREQHICATRMQSFEHLRNSLRSGGAKKKIIARGQP